MYLVQGKSASHDAMTPHHNYQQYISLWTIQSILCSAENQSMVIINKYLISDASISIWLYPKIKIINRMGMVRAKCKTPDHIAS